MRLTHGSSWEYFAHQVWSSGFRLRDNGKVYLAFNVHLENSSHYASTIGKERIGCYDSVNHAMDFYMEKDTDLGRAASLAMIDDSKFYLGGFND